MGILSWDKPKKAKTTAEWANDGGFDGGPVGGYLPNMSKEDEKKWKAKLVGKTTDHPQVEIRKTVNCQLLLIVSLGKGYNYKYYKANPTPRDGYSTKGINVHLSTNGALQLTFKEMQEMNEAVEEAKAFLINLITEKSMAIVEKLKTKTG